jgi:cytochrome d ubiquinol oxidase subunit II
LRKSVAGDRPLKSFILSSAAFAGLWGMAGSYLFPNLVVNNAGESITIYNSSSGQLTLTVMLIIALIGVPIMLAYTYYVYRIFKGKTVISH